MKENHYIIIRSLAMANWLVRQGFDIKKVDDSEINDKFKVFLFHESDELHDAMVRFPKKSKRGA